MTPEQEALAADAREKKELVRAALREYSAAFRTATDAGVPYSAIFDREED